MNEPDPQRIAEAAGRCPSVARLHVGPAASYLPGSRVPGVSVNADTVTVHVDIAYPATVTILAGELRGALAELLAGRRLDISVEDVSIEDVALPRSPQAAVSPSEHSPGVQS